jgi:hemoglobin/transferrin/lactoferrin receptor protein
LKINCAQASLLSQLSLAIGLVFASPAVLAAPKIIDINMASQPLNQTLNELARQSNMTLLFDGELTKNLTSPAISGPVTLRDALFQALNNTGLHAEIKGNIIMLHIKPEHTATQIGTLRVQGAMPAPGMFNEEDIDTADLPYVKMKSTVHVSGKNIERFRGTSPADILKGVPGVQVGEARNGGAIDVNIRGVQGQNRVPVVIDGSVQSTNVYRGYAGVADRSYLDPDFISDIKIEKGPTLTAQGSGAIGGVVSMETLKTTDILLEGERSGLRMRGGIQSNSLDAPKEFAPTPRTDSPNLWDSDADFASLAYAVKEERFELVVALAYRDQGNYFAGTKGRGNYFEQKERTRWVEKDGKWESEDYIEEVEGISRFFKAGDEVLNTSSATQSALFKSTFHITDEQAIEMGYRYFESDYGEIMSSQIYRNSGDTLPQWKESNQNIDTYTLRYKYKPQDSQYINLKANLWHTDTNSLAYNGSVFTNPRQDAPSPDQHDCESCVDVLYRADTQAQRTGFDISNHSKFNSDIGLITLDYGFSWQHENIGPGSSVKYSTEDLLFNRLHRDGTRDEKSVFISAKWAAKDWLSFELGGRYQKFKTEEHNTTSRQQHIKYKEVRLLGDNGFPFGSVSWFQDENGEYSDITDPRVTGDGNVYMWGTTNYPSISEVNYVDSRVLDNEHKQYIDEFIQFPGTSKSNSGFTPTFAINIQLAPFATMYVNHSQGLRMPSMMESTRGWSVSSKVLDVEPEHAKNWELGLNLIKDSLLVEGDKSRFKIAIFDNTINNFITRRPLDKKEHDVSDTDIGLAMSNAEKYQLRGIELQSTFDMGIFYADLSATYYTKTTVCDSYFNKYINEGGYWKDIEIPNCSETGFSGMYVSNQIPPKKSATLNLGSRLLNDTLDFGLRATYVGEPVSNVDQEDFWVNYFGSATYIPTKQHTLIDLYASYKITEQVEVKFNIDNLTDRYYFDAHTLSLMPAPGRTVRLSLGAYF